MISTLKIAAMTVLTLGNLLLLGVSMFYWKQSQDKASKAGFGFMTLLTISNILSSVGGAFL